MLREIGSHLPDFGAPKAMVRPDMRSSLEQQLAEAEERGRRAGEEAARAETRQFLEAAGHATERRIAEERRRWVAEESERLAASFSATAAAAERRVEDTLARVLMPFVGALVRERMLADLRRTLASLFEKGDMRLKVSGPPDLIEALRARCTEAPAATEWLTADAAEVTIECGDALFETQLAAWCERAATVVAGVGNG